MKPSVMFCRFLFFALTFAGFGNPVLRADDASVGARTSDTNRPLNILLLYADDWRHDTLGVAGNPVVQTPTLDQLASEGYRFTRNCVTTAICGISRATLFTGQWMSRHGNRSFKMWETPWEETFPGLLRSNGYYVGHVGKWHNGRIPADRFDFARAYGGKHWIEQKDGEKIHVTQKNEKDALEFLQTRPDDKPFCLTVAFFATHAEDKNPLQFLPQPESMELYRDVTIPVPENATQESFERLPEFVGNEKNEGRNRWHWRFDTPEKFQTMMKNYYRLATEVDSTCGRLLSELERQDIAENTLVIFTTDNGYYHAEHGLADKWYPHEESIRVPLIIRDPRMPQEAVGQTSEAMTLNVDLAPTILLAAGIEPPETMQGKDISPLYRSEGDVEWREEYFYEHPMHKSSDFIPASEALVRKDWKYFYWPEFDREQLFHLTNDPIEEHDLATNPEHAAKLSEMRERFRELKASAE
ncbi:MAG: sulfatase [Rhodopirellula sp. JB044]|uniref:sulfatase family protein n=1 Tax=Rhodopirellula sp. JB044 TaxID=3342844 RepID=UPI00370A764D